MSVFFARFAPSAYTPQSRRQPLHFSFQPCAHGSGAGACRFIQTGAGNSTSAGLFTIPQSPPPQRNLAASAPAQDLGEWLSRRPGHGVQFRTLVSGDPDGCQGRAASAQGGARHLRQHRDDDGVAEDNFALVSAVVGADAVGADETERPAAVGRDQAESALDLPGAARAADLDAAGPVELVVRRVAVVPAIRRAEHVADFDRDGALLAVVVGPEREVIELLGRVVEEGDECFGAAHGDNVYRLLAPVKAESKLFPERP